MKQYNWWTDPANAEEVKRLSWWEHPENKTFLQIPISIIEKDGYCVIAANKDTEKMCGDLFSGINASGQSREETLNSFFELIRVSQRWEIDRRLSYERWVPFRRGSWNRRASFWFVIFGINFYFRYGKHMKGGWYIPFTKLNISVTNLWKTYNRWKKENK